MRRSWLLPAVAALVVSASIALQGCGGSDPTPKPTPSPPTIAPTPKPTASPTTPAPTPPTPSPTPSPTPRPTPRPIKPAGGNPEDKVVLVYDNTPIIFSPPTTLWTGTPSKGHWVLRSGLGKGSAPDWYINQTIEFKKAHEGHHGGLRVPAEGNMTVTFHTGVTCHLHFGHDGKNATASTTCDPHIIGAFDPNNPKSITFNIVSVPEKQDVEFVG